MGTVGGAEEVEIMVKNAVNAGYRKFDTVSIVISLDAGMTPTFTGRHLDTATKSMLERYSLFRSIHKSLSFLNIVMGGHS